MDIQDRYKCISQNNPFDTGLILLAAILNEKMLTRQDLFDFADYLLSEMDKRNVNVNTNGGDVTVKLNVSGPIEIGTP